MKRGLLGRVAMIAQRLPASRSKVRAGRLLAAAAGQVGCHPVVTVPLKDGTELILDARGRTEAEPVFNGTFEEHTLTVLRACVPPGGTLLDVGANVGLVALPMARFLAGSGGQVIAVEPLSCNADRIRAAAKLNAVDVQVVECALGDHDGTIEISREAALGAETGNAVMGAAGAGYGLTSTVVLRTLDSLHELQGVNVLKVDIEGAELQLLRGGERFVCKHRPLILGEFNAVFMPKFGHTFADLAPLLDAWDYKVVAWDADGAPVVIVPEAGRGNAMLIPAERLKTTLSILTNLQ